MDKYAKAVVGAVMAILAALLTALTDGQVASVEYVVMAMAGLGSLAVVWGVPNTPVPDDVQAPRGRVNGT